ncbi:MAG: glycoside hydrolase family 3 C-terminal domain-containing protein, partial [Rikenellaceae bacterium]|nr:glycoside hydrolase family 3 C-terminal domain-containing protein [Rikenellaceae bacterium]
MGRIPFLLAFALLAFGARAQQYPYQNTALDFETRARDLISRMTAEEKVSQMVNAAAGIERLGILPYDWWSEALHGVARNGRATVFPQAIGMAATWDTTLVRRVASAIGDEGRAKFNAAQRTGNHVIYAGLTFWTPNINIFRDPRWGRGQETYGEDPFLTSRIGVAFVRGLQGDDPRYLKVAACAKHYAVHSGPEGERHTFDANPSKKDLYETYLPAFEALVKEAGVEAVMGAYNRVYGESASGSNFLLTELLRDRWGFRGHVVSDCGAIDDIWRTHKLAPDAATASAIALKAGLDLNCGSTYKSLAEALQRGLVTEDDIDWAMMRLVMTKMKLGLFDPPSANPYNAIPESVVGSPEHIALARQAAAESMVLLKNDNNLLPLKKDAAKYFVTGPYASDNFVLMGNYYGVSGRMVSFLEGITSKVGLATKIEYRYGIQPTTPNVGRGGGSGEVRGSDATIVFIGLTGLMEGEEGDAIASSFSGDKTTISLPPHQIAFLQQLRDGSDGRPIIAVVTGGSAVDLREVSRLSDAVVLAWYPGQEGGAALADLLFGDAGFSGRLPVTCPVSDGVLPAFDDYSMKGRTYKYMADGVMYPFGYGLTYTRFEYSNLRIDGKIDGENPLTVEMTLRNTGEREGEEVVQLYLSTPEAGTFNPISTLVAFGREKLAPGAVKTVRLV